MKNNLNEEEKEYFKKIKDELYFDYLTEYRDFSNYISKDFFEKEYNNFINTYKHDSGINPKVLFKINIENKTMYMFCDYIRNGNVDLEIELIDKYNSHANLIMSKMKVVDYNKEDIVMEALESYYGDKTFELHIVDIIKQKRNKKVIDKVNEVKPAKVITKDVVPNKIIHTSDKPIIKKETNVVANKLTSELVDKYIKKNVPTLAKPLYVDYLINYLNILDDIKNKTKYEYIYDYMCLKFGKYNNMFFKDEDIIKMLNISSSKCMQYYIDSLSLLKGIINTKVDNIIINDLDFTKKYIK